ncbi:DUF262 domain-containing protein [Caminibacter mediatlanticus TB-2]|uniref:DUF262 domain-containing protein n=1 Tax=Caminibacter mediatlanticus TB-2 TaxID=391592 RepID=A0ABX5V9V0_9BACT|nr:DUF262 domain-containing protein [Caminibacter mediatlanticus]QCT95033.1 DUF262 domain-containing protein [Caminibacter mediatlanticus TB-2]
MKNNNLLLKPIEDIINENFVIPSYQRGYRWESRQVLDLLQDIYEFAESKKKEEFYCLQPIVITKKDNKYRVIDGQQRLTTIYLILKFLQETANKIKNIKQNNIELLEFCNIEEFEIKNIFSLEYETREKSKEFLENISTENLNYDNPDFYYMSKAYEKIKKWFKTHSKKLFLDTLLKDVKFIWYEVNTKNEEEEIEIFKRLNIGKIPLTNAELIKAMLLIPIKEYKKQIEFSIEWDRIEHTLQKNSFWYFLTNDNKKATAIDLIFDTLAKKYYKENKFNDFKLKENDDKYSFYVFDKLLKEEKKTQKDIWEDTKKVFRFLIDWYNDKEIYHKVGYLLYFKENLLDLISKYSQTTKDKFKDYLNERIRNSLGKKINLNELSYGDINVKKVLLLFNIETALNSQNIRFNFAQFKTFAWDIEHIVSQTDNENKEEWVKTVFEYIYGMNIKKIDKNKLKNFVNKYYEKFFDRVKKRLGIKDLSQDKNNIANLTLLDSKTNRSYHNAFFPIKRTIIIENESKGYFIPPATKNVFLKAYSQKLSDIANWTDEDMDCYRNKIYELLSKYGVKL